MNVASILPLAPVATRVAATGEAPSGFLERLAGQLGDDARPVEGAGRELPDGDAETAPTGADAADDAEARASLLAHVTLGRFPSVTLPAVSVEGEVSLTEHTAGPSSTAPTAATTTATTVPIVTTTEGGDDVSTAGEDHAATATAAGTSHGAISTEATGSHGEDADLPQVVVRGTSSGSTIDVSDVSSSTPVSRHAPEPAEAPGRVDAPVPAHRGAERAGLLGREAVGASARPQPDAARTVRAEGGEVATAATLPGGVPAGNAPEPTNRLALPSAAAQRVLDIVSQLEDSPPPRVVVIESGELRVRVGLDAGVVRLTVLGETTEAGDEVLREAADALANEGFETELDRPSGGPADGDGDHPTDARPSTADVTDGDVDRDRSSTRPRAGLQL